MVKALMFETKGFKFWPTKKYVIRPKVNLSKVIPEIKLRGLFLPRLIFYFVRQWIQPHFESIH